VIVQRANTIWQNNVLVSLRERRGKKEHVPQV